MLDLSTLALFSAAALALLVVPGPAVLYIVTQSIGRRRRAGFVSVAGIHTGALVHVAAAAVGLSSLLVSSAVAFNVVKYAGAAYLVYLGVRRLLGRDGLAEPATGESTRSLWRVYRRGVVVNVLNPKTALFFFAFLPQFVDPDRGAVALQIVVLGLVFIALGVATDSVWAALAGLVSRRLRPTRRFLLAERYLSGSVLVGLGVTAALTGNRRAA